MTYEVHRSLSTPLALPAWWLSTKLAENCKTEAVRWYGHPTLLWIPVKLLLRRKRKNAVDSM